MSDPAAGAEPPPAFVQKPKKAPRSTRVWLVLAILLTALWAFATSFQPLTDGGVESGPERVAFAVGTAVGGLLGAVLICAGVVWLILYFGFTRRLARQRGPVHFGVLALTALLAAAPMTALKIVGVFASGAPPEVSRIMEDHEQRLAERINYIEADREVLLMNAPFAPHSLAAPGGVTKARATAVKMREILTRMDATTVEEAARTRAALEALDMSASRRERLLKAFDASLAADLARNREAAALSGELLTALDAQLAVLGRTPRGWAVENGAVAFRNPTDMRDYNAAVERAQQIEARLKARQAATGTAADGEGGTPAAD